MERRVVVQVPRVAGSLFNCQQEEAAAAAAGTRQVDSFSAATAELRGAAE